MPQRSLSTCRTEDRFGFFIRFLAPHTTEGKLKKHIFSEPSRIPSIPDNAIKITPGFICSREYRPAISRSMSGETKREALHRDTVHAHAFHVGSIIA